MNVGGWTVIPEQNLLQRDGHSIKLEPRAIELLVYLARRAGAVVATEDLMADVWRGRIVEDSAIYKRINELRKAFGDDPKHPTFIETIPKRGYRLIAPVTAAATSAAPTSAASGEPAPVACSSEEARPDANAMSATRRSRQLMLASLIGAATLLAVVGLALVDVRAPPDADIGLTFTPLPYEQDGSESLFLPGAIVWKPDGTAIAFAAVDRNTRAPPRPYTLYLDSPSAMPLAARELAAGGVPKAWTPAGHIRLLTRLGSTSTSESAGLFTVPAVGGSPVHLLDVPPGTTNVLALTPDGETVAALRRDENGDWGIWAGSVASGALRRYEPAPFAARQFVNSPSLAFSPDGRQLMLWWSPSVAAGVFAGEQAWLMQYPPDASRPPRIVLQSLPSGAGTPSFSWLPDNRHVVVSTAERFPPRLYLADTETGRFRALSDAPGSMQQTAPVVSPDGRRLLFAEVFVDYDIVTLNVHTGDVSPLIATNRMEQGPAWSTAASSFVYVADRNGEFEIWVHEQDMPDRPLVTWRDFPPDTTFSLYGPQLSPDGKRLIYGRIEADANGATDAHLWISAVAGGAPMKFAGTAGRQIPGSWSPDGAWYVYFEVHPDSSVFLMKARTSGQFEAETLAALREGTPMLPVWSPDGAWILFDDGGLKLISADGSTTRDLGMKDTLCTFARGRDLLYCVKDIRRAASFVTSDFTGVTQSVAAIAGEHRPQQLFGPSLRLSLTPDGDGVSYSVNSSRVRMLLVDGLAELALP